MGTSQKVEFAFSLLPLTSTTILPLALVLV